MKPFFANAYIAVLIVASLVMGGTLILHASEQKPQTTLAETGERQETSTVTQTEENAQSSLTAEEPTNSMLTVALETSSVPITVASTSPALPQGAVARHGVKHVGDDEEEPGFDD